MRDRRRHPGPATLQRVTQVLGQGRQLCLAPSALDVYKRQIQGNLFQDCIGTLVNQGEMTIRSAQIIQSNLYNLGDLSLQGVGEETFLNLFCDTACNFCLLYTSIECVVFMGKEDTVRQALNVYRMRLLGATVVPVTSGTATLKDAVSEAMGEWTRRISDTHYCLGSVMGPHPFPTIVRDFQAVISKEIKEQILAKEGRLPDAVIACVGGGSNAIGSCYHRGV